MPDCLMSPPVCRAAQASREALASASGALPISASYQRATASRYSRRGWSSPMTRTWLATWSNGLSGMAPVPVGSPQAEGRAPAAGHCAQPSTD